MENKRDCVSVIQFYVMIGKTLEMIPSDVRNAWLREQQTVLHRGTSLRSANIFIYIQHLCIIVVISLIINPSYYIFAIFYFFITFSNLSSRGKQNIRQLYNVTLILLRPLLRVTCSRVGCIMHFPGIVVRVSHTSVDFHTLVLSQLVNVRVSESLW